METTQITIDLIKAQSQAPNGFYTFMPVMESFLYHYI